MYLAQCPHCKTIYQTDFSVLGPHGGQVSCGECHQLFNALDHPFIPPTPETSTPEKEVAIVPPTPASTPKATPQALTTSSVSQSATTEASPKAGLEPYDSLTVTHKVPPSPESRKMPESDTASSLNPDLSFLLIDPVGGGMPPFGQESIPLEADPPLGKVEVSAQENMTDIKDASFNLATSHDSTVTTSEGEPAIIEDHAEEPTIDDPENLEDQKTFNLATSHDTTVTASEGEPSVINLTPEEPTIVETETKDDPLVSTPNIETNVSGQKEDPSVAPTLQQNSTINDTGTVCAEQEVKTLSPDDDAEVDALLALLKGHAPADATGTTTSDPAVKIVSPIEEETLEEPVILAADTKPGEIIPTAQPKKTGSVKWIVLGIILALLLIAQALYFFRDTLGLYWPW